MIRPSRVHWSMWCAIIYLIVGVLFAMACFLADGESRFGVLQAYGVYAWPTTYVIHIAGVSDEFFGDWPHAVYWTGAAVLLNGAILYVFLIAVRTLFTRFTRRPNQSPEPTSFTAGNS